MKTFKYLSYIIRHKWFVFIAACRLGIPFRGMVHDMSKFLPSEWLPYLRYFYGKYPTKEEAKRALKIAMVTYSRTAETVARDFDLAWLKHQHRNPHHWQYWLLREDKGATKVLQMPQKYMLEMLADWVGAGRAIKGKIEVKKWYQSNRGEIVLHSQTRREIEWLLSGLEWLS